jgi:hypothetical protein
VVEVHSLFEIFDVVFDNGALAIEPNDMLIIHLGGTHVGNNGVVVVGMIVTTFNLLFLCSDEDDL